MEELLSAMEDAERRSQAAAAACAEMKRSGDFKMMSAAEQVTAAIAKEFEGLLERASALDARSKAAKAAFKDMKAKKKEMKEKKAADAGDSKKQRASQKSFTAKPARRDTETLATSPSPAQAASAAALRVQRGLQEATNRAAAKKKSAESSEVVGYSFGRAWDPSSGY